MGTAIAMEATRHNATGNIAPIMFIFGTITREFYHC